MALGARRVDREGAFSGNNPQRAIIDIGSNSVRLVLYGGSLRAPTILFNEKVIARLGMDMTDGRLAKPARQIALRGLRRFALILHDLGITDIETVATAAVRDAENRERFIEKIRATGLEPRVLSGQEEARLSAMGVIGAFPGAQGVVADLGGGSLEFLRIAPGESSEGTTLPLGTLRLPGLVRGSFSATSKALGEIMDAGGWGEPIGAPLYLVGGTWRALAVHAMHRRGDVLTDPHGLELSPGDARTLARDIAKTDFDTLRANPRISTQRAELLPSVGPLLDALLDMMRPEKVVFSSWGLREGLLFDRLPPEQQAQDPLLAGMAVFANMRGCPPTLATRIAGWTVNAMPPGWQGSERVRLAATSLALASMQIEPNFRMDIATGWALQKRWLDVTPEERAVMAATVAANGNHCDLPASITELADAARLEAAICWGLAIRLCRRIGGRSRASLQASSLSIRGGRLVLSLEDSRKDLYGLPNEKDMALLAERLGLEPEVAIVPDATISTESPP